MNNEFHHPNQIFMLNSKKKVVSELEIGDWVRGGGRAADRRNLPSPEVSLVERFQSIFLTISINMKWQLRPKSCLQRNVGNSENRGSQRFHLTRCCMHQACGDITQAGPTRIQRKKMDRTSFWGWMSDTNLGL